MGKAASVTTQQTETKGYSRTSAHGSVVHELGEEIVSGQLKSGDVLPGEVELMDRFSISRNSLREAIKVLSGKGLVEARQRVGVIVKDRSSWNFLDVDVLRWQIARGVDAQFLEHLIEVRQTIEPAAAAFAAKRASMADLARIDRACSEMEAQCADRPAFLRADVDFHAAILYASRNPMMTQFVACIRTLLECSFAIQQDIVSPDKEYLAADAAVHRKVLGRIQCNDVKGAEEQMRQIVEEGARILFQYIEQQGR